MYEHDEWANLVRQVDRNGRVRVFGYDDDQRLREEIWYNTVADADLDQDRQNTITWTYDAAGNLLSVVDDFSSYTYAYDASGRVTTETVSNVGGPVTVLTTDYGTRTDDRPVSLSVTVDGTPDLVKTFVYDADDRLVAMSQTGQGGRAVADKLVTFTYDEGGQFVSITRYASLDASRLVAVSEATYDDLGRLVDLVHYQDPADPLAEYTWTWAGGGNTVDVALTGTPPGPQFGSGWMFSLGGSFAHTLSRDIDINPLPDYVWTFDAAFTGHLTQMTSPDGTADYTYDPRGQLLAADYDYQPGEFYTYDANGNRTNPGYITGDHNRLLSDGTYTYQYDAEGNRTRRTHVVTGAVTEYVWDHRNRLTAVIDRAGEGGPIIQSVHCAYDTQNRWIGRQLDSDGDGLQAPVDASFVYDGNQILLRLDGTGGVSNRYLWGPAVDQLLADEQVTDPTAPGNILWPLTDHLGTVRDLAAYDAPTGSTTIVNHITHDAYGQILTQTDPTFTTLFAFTARPYDPATGLQNNHHRWYDPATGRWLSEDPIAFAAGDANLYRYVENIPTVYLDPSGLDPPGWYGLDPSGVGAYSGAGRPHAPAPADGFVGPDAPSQGSPDDENRIKSWAMNEDARKYLDELFRIRDEARGRQRGYGDCPDGHTGACAWFRYNFKQLLEEYFRKLATTSDNPNPTEHDVSMVRLEIYKRTGIRVESKMWDVAVPRLALQHIAIVVTVDEDGNKRFFMDAGRYGGLGAAQGNLGGCNSIWFSGDMQGTLRDLNTEPPPRDPIPYHGWYPPLAPRP